MQRRFTALPHADGFVFVGNAPEPAAMPPTPPIGSRLLASRRHLHGRQHFAATLNWWLGRSAFSHARLGAIADWALGENGWLISSQVSHLRNANVRQPGYQSLDALCCANEAIWRWQVKGKGDCHRIYGPHSGYGIEDGWLDEAVWLGHPDEPEAPLNFGDWCELVVGYLELPYVGDVVLSPGEAKDLSQRLAALLEGIVKGQGLGIRDGMARIIECYPVQERNRRERLRGVVLGLYDYSQEDLIEELWALAVTVAALRGQDPAGYGPAELHAELTSSRRRV
jgi:hypothetical protein